MPQADTFKCRICGQMCDITNQEIKVLGMDGKPRKQTANHGYHEIRFMDYGARTTIKVPCCGTCKQNVIVGKNTTTLMGHQSQWGE